MHILHRRRHLFFARGLQYFFLFFCFWGFPSGLGRGGREEGGGFFFLIPLNSRRVVFCTKISMALSVYLVFVVGVLSLSLSLSLLLLSLMVVDKFKMGV